MHVSTGRPHTTCMFDTCSMAVDCRKTATVSDGWAAVHCKVASRRVPRFDEGGRKFWVLSQTVLFFFVLPSFLPRSSPLFLPWSKSAIISRRKYFLMRGLPPDGRTDGQTAGRTGQAARARVDHTRKGIGRRQRIKAIRPRARARWRLK